MDVKLGKKVFIRDIGKDENWLQDILYDNPGILGFGYHLRTVKREKRESSSGRFHILLQDIGYDLRYEVEVMLGETDASHIVTALEYWDNERRKHSASYHGAILVAESFEGRYFNLLQTLCMKLPVMVIQANLLEVDKEYVLSFTRIFSDLSTGPQDGEEPITVDESVWLEKAPWTLNAAKMLCVLIDADDKSIDYMQNSISIWVKGKEAYRLRRSCQPSSVVSFWAFDNEKVDAIRTLFSNNNFAPYYSLNQNREFVLTVDEDMINSKKAMFEEVIKIRYKPLLSHR